MDMAVLSCRIHVITNPQNDGINSCRALSVPTPTICFYQNSTFPSLMPQTFAMPFKQSKICL